MDETPSPITPASAASPASPLTPATPLRPPSKRLILCLDGTWNTQDSNTAIFHLSNLVADTETGGTSDDTSAGGVKQLVYYDTGVGTGMFDYLSGGVFGFGIDDNIRQAYEWLIEKYEEGDEIYIFGFSRGAYTARTLGGMLGKLGLPRPGAPLTVTQLWEAYTLIGRVEKPKDNWWEALTKKPTPPCRPIIELKWDDGSVRVTDPNRTEKLMIEWCRRPDIHCMGIFDTVGAIGWDALAIPGLRTRIGHFHNANLNILIRHGFQALAIDEQRPQFKCVPWRRFVPSGPPREPTPRERSQVIEQRWFTGAHSNIGGGYEDNPLALFPLCWMIERLQGVGLHFRKIKVERPRIADCTPLTVVQELRPADCQSKKPYLRDSYAEFVGGILRPFPWRFHRPIAAPPVQHETGTDESIGEVVDESVAELWRADPAYRPENLREYYARTGQVPPG